MRWIRKGEDVGPAPGKVVLVAHYARFDVGVLHLDYGRENAVLPDVPVLESWAVAGWLNIAGRKRSLGGRRPVELTDSLELSHPRLAHAKSRHLELLGDHDAALTLIDATVATRGTSSDRAWVDLLSHRGAVPSRKAALARIPATPPPDRFGHSAPTDRPDRRRFTLPAVARRWNKRGAPERGARVEDSGAQATWAAKFAVACRCAQEVREIMFDPYV